MNFFDAIKAGFRNYTNFSTRATRPEFWYWVLFTVIAGMVTSILDLAIFPGSTLLPVNSIFNLITVIPSLAVGARRLHDIGRTGWWQLLSLSVIGLIVLIYWWCQRGEPGPNRYNAAPAGV